MTSRSVILVCGPPCAGKTTLVTSSARPDDYVLDHDQLARAAGSPARWHHARRYREAAEQVMAEGLEYLASVDEERAWVIRTAPDAAERAALASFIRASAVALLVPPPEVLHERAAAERLPMTHTAIDRWFARYTP